MNPADRTASAKPAPADREDVMAEQPAHTGQASRRPPARRTRRQLLAGGTGALAAVLTAEALARPAPAVAANGDAVLLGQTNFATSLTFIGINSSPSNPNIPAFEAGGAGSGAGVTGFSESGPGVQGSSQSGTGVSATCATGNGVSGQSGLTASALTAGIGVSGITDKASGFGVSGENSGGGTAVSGVAKTGAGTGVAGTGGPNGGLGVSGAGGGTGGTGVSGVGAGIGVGVSGIGGSSSGQGMQGFGGGPNGTGVEGFGSGSGHGVHGAATTTGGAGVLAVNGFGGNALQVAGKAVFSRSGVLTLAAGKSSAVQTGVALTAASLVLATLQQDRSGVWVRSAVPNVAASSFTVNLSKAVTASTKVAWFVVN